MVFLTRTPFATDTSSAGRPAMFQLRTSTGFDSTSLSSKLSEMGICSSTALSSH